MSLVEFLGFLEGEKYSLSLALFSLVMLFFWIRNFSWAQGLTFGRIGTLFDSIFGFEPFFLVGSILDGYLGPMSEGIGALRTDVVHHSRSWTDLKLVACLRSLTVDIEDFLGEPSLLVFYAIQERRPSRVGGHRASRGASSIGHRLVSLGRDISEREEVVELLREELARRGNWPLRGPLVLAFLRGSFQSC